MTSYQSVSSARGQRRARNERNTSDDKIDFSDIPELIDEQLAKAKRLGRPRSESPSELHLNYSQTFND